MNRHNGNHLHGMNEGPMELMEVEMGDELDPHRPAQKPSAKSLSPIVSDHALNVLNELREANLLCDAQISVGEQSFNVHRAIMCSCSSYFRWVYGTFAKANESRLISKLIYPSPTLPPSSSCRTALSSQVSIAARAPAMRRVASCTYPASVHP